MFTLFNDLTLQTQIIGCNWKWHLHHKYWLILLSQINTAVLLSTDSTTFIICSHFWGTHNSPKTSEVERNMLCQSLGQHLFSLRFDIKVGTCVASTGKPAAAVMVAGYGSGSIWVRMDNQTSEITPSITSQLHYWYLIQKNTQTQQSSVCRQIWIEIIHRQ